MLLFDYNLVDIRTTGYWNIAVFSELTDEQKLIMFPANFI